MILRADVIVAFLLKASQGQAANVQRQGLISYFYLTPNSSPQVEMGSQLTSKNKVTYKRDYNYKPKTTNYKLIEWQ
jgi:hypothetical protein